MSIDQRVNDVLITRISLGDSTGGKFGLPGYFEGKQRESLSPSKQRAWWLKKKNPTKSGEWKWKKTESCTDPRKVENQVFAGWFGRPVAVRVARGVGS